MRVSGQLVCRRPNWREFWPGRGWRRQSVALDFVVSPRRLPFCVVSVCALFVSCSGGAFFFLLLASRLLLRARRKSCVIISRYSARFQRERERDRDTRPFRHFSDHFFAGAHLICAGRAHKEIRIAARRRRRLVSAAAARAADNRRRLLSRRKEKREQFAGRRHVIGTLCARDGRL